LVSLRRKEGPNKIKKRGDHVQQKRSTLIQDTEYEKKTPKGKFGKGFRGSKKKEGATLHLQRGEELTWEGGGKSE